MTSDKLIDQTAIDAKSGDQGALEKDLNAILHRDIDYSQPQVSARRLQQDEQALEKAGVPQELVQRLGFMPAATHSHVVGSTRAEGVHRMAVVTPDPRAEANAHLEAMQLAGSGDCTEKYIKRDGAGHITHTGTGYDFLYDKQGNLEKIDHVVKNGVLSRDDDYHRGADGNWYRYTDPGLRVGMNFPVSSDTPLAAAPELNPATGELTIRSDSGHTQRLHADGSSMMEVQGRPASTWNGVGAYSFVYDTAGKMSEVQYHQGRGLAGYGRQDFAWLRQGDGTWAKQVGGTASTDYRAARPTGEKLKDIKVDSAGNITEIYMGGDPHVHRLERQ